jgi:homoserine kinase type II
MRKNYDLGEVTRIKEVSGGYCNKSFAILMSNNDHSRRYFLRLYNPNVIEKEIRFEHALLNHLRSNGFTLAAAIIPCRNRQTIVSTPPPDNHRGAKSFWALFEFLDGEDKYSWTRTDLADGEFLSAAEILAHLHHCGHGFEKPPGADRAQPPIMEWMPTFKNKFAGFLMKAGHRRCDRLLKNHFQLICETLEHGASFGAGFKGLPQIPIHCDYHPGNLKFANETAVGIFDFDWSKIDYRLFDVALGLVYFTSLWTDPPAGLRPDKFSLFLGTYHRACQCLANISPLTDQEQGYLVPMLAIANLYVLNWELVEFYETPEPDDDEYFKFIDHTLGLMHWIGSNGGEVELWVEKALSQTVP